MKQLLGILSLLMAFASLAQEGVRKEDWLKIKAQNFDSLLTDLNIRFTVPADFSESALVENDKVLYHKAYRHVSGFEFRIWIRDVRNQQLPEGMTDDQFSKSFVTMLSLNASGNVLPIFRKSRYMMKA